jgi:hypothetical protein
VRAAGWRGVGEPPRGAHWVSSTTRSRNAGSSTCRNRAPSAVSRYPSRSPQRGQTGWRTRVPAGMRAVGARYRHARLTVGGRCRFPDSMPWMTRNEGAAPALSVSRALGSGPGRTSQHAIGVDDTRAGRDDVMTRHRPITGRGVRRGKRSRRRRRRRSPSLAPWWRSSKLGRCAGDNEPCGVRAIDLPTLMPGGGEAQPAGLRPAAMVAASPPPAAHTPFMAPDWD